MLAIDNENGFGGTLPNFGQFVLDENFQQSALKFFHNLFIQNSEKSCSFFPFFRYFILFSNGMPRNLLTFIIGKIKAAQNEKQTKNYSLGT